MDNKQFTETQSLELIAAMIRDSRTRLARNSGSPFLIWGYVTVAVSLFEAFAIRYFDNPEPWMWGWFAIPLLGKIGMLLFARKDHGARNYIDRVISAIWTVIGIALVTMVSSFLNHVFILSTIITMVGMGTAITGMVIRDRTTTAAGFMAIAATLIYPLREWLFARFSAMDATTATIEFAMRWNSDSVLIFAAIFLVLMVIPGHILNRKCNRACSKS